jgi:hypothetical protein
VPRARVLFLSPIRETIWGRALDAMQSATRDYKADPADTWTDDWSTYYYKLGPELLYPGAFRSGKDIAS